MDDGDALLIRILSDPADDGPRLVYADWLEEHAGSKACGRCKGGGRVFAYRLLTTGNTDPCPACDGTGSVPNSRATRAAYIRWAVAHPQNSAVCLCGCRGRLPRPCETCRMMGAAVEGIPRRANGETHYVAHRGFVSEVRVSAVDWLRVADALAWHPEHSRDVCPECEGRKVKRYTCANHKSGHEGDCWQCEGAGTVPRPCPPTAQPIERVEIPGAVRHGTIFRGTGDGDIPAPLFALLRDGRTDRTGGGTVRRYTDERVAADDLSAACLRWARGERAEIDPPLPTARQSDYRQFAQPRTGH